MTAAKIAAALNDLKIVFICVVPPPETLFRIHSMMFLKPKHRHRFRVNSDELTDQLVASVWPQHLYSLVCSTKAKASRRRIVDIPLIIAAVSSGNDVCSVRSKVGRHIYLSCGPQDRSLTIRVDRNDPFAFSFANVFARFLL